MSFPFLLSIIKYYQTLQWDGPIWGHKLMIFLLDHKHSAGKMKMIRSKIALSNKIKSSICGETEKTLGNTILYSCVGTMLALTNISKFSLHKVFYHISCSCISHPLLFPVMCSFFGSSCTSLLAHQTPVGFCHFYFYFLFCSTRPVWSSE